MTQELDRVRAHTADHVNARLDEERVRSVATHVGASPSEVTKRLEELDREWDVERVLEANAATLTVLAVGLAALSSRRWLLLAGAVPAFLLQHAVQGWCPPIEVIRRLGVRTRREIDAERTALKMTRGDFRDPGVGDTSVADPVATARAALAAAGRR